MSISHYTQWMLREYNTLLLHTVLYTLWYISYVLYTRAGHWWTMTYTHFYLAYTSWNSSIKLLLSIDRHQIRKVDIFPYLISIPHLHSSRSFIFIVLPLSSSLFLPPQSSTLFLILRDYQIHDQAYRWLEHVLFGISTDLSWCNISQPLPPYVLLI